jgi:hypothetical protein
VLSEHSPCTGACELTALTAGATIAERRVAVENVPEGGRSVLSPDGKLLYLVAPAEGGGGAALADLRLTDGSVKPLNGALVDTNFGYLLQFSSDGRWMFFVDADRRHVDVLDREGRQAYRVKGTFSNFTQITVLPS